MISKFSAQSKVDETRDDKGEGEREAAFNLIQFHIKEALTTRNVRKKGKIL